MGGCAFQQQVCPEPRPIDIQPNNPEVAIAGDSKLPGAFQIEQVAERQENIRENVSMAAVEDGSQRPSSIDVRKQLVQLLQKAKFGPIPLQDSRVHISISSSSNFSHTQEMSRQPSRVANFYFGSPMVVEDGNSDEA